MCLESALCASDFTSLVCITQCKTTAVAVRKSSAVHARSPKQRCAAAYVQSLHQVG
jgi:hypothetical protein